MYSIVHLLVLGSLDLSSEKFFTFYIYFILFYIFISPTAIIHDIQRANRIQELIVTERSNLTFTKHN